MVAYKKAIPNVDALNDAKTKFVLTPDSPSETLARVVMAHFDLESLEEEPIVEARDAEDVYRRYRTARPDTHQVFVLWEPYVSKVLENPNTHVVIDSGSFHGYIVDVIVANEDYLLKNKDVVADVVEAYFRSLYAHQDKMVELVLADARELGTPLTRKQAENLVKGVRWKNTRENYAHLGLHQVQTLQHVEDMISNITNVLLQTGAVRRDPTKGEPNRLYYDKVLARLQDADFHPGVGEESVRGEEELPELSDADWARLVPVGTMEVPPLVFARGTATLTSKSRVVLDDLIEKLETLRYYVLIRGNASRRGDLEANKALAQQRAKAAEQYLIQNGINENRVRAVGVEPSGSTSVSFVLGRPAY
jgi:outer membrane protein OmpA-like peptidoglycan-associated protein